MVVTPSSAAIAILGIAKAELYIVTEDMIASEKIDFKNVHEESYVKNETFSTTAVAFATLF